MDLERLYQFYPQAPHFMGLALQEAQKAAHKGEIPVGAVIVRQGEVLAQTHNRRQELNDLWAHAECLAISQACQKLKDWRLNDCQLYVTLEPCPMCAGAMLQAKISQVFFGAYNLREGCAGSLVQLLDFPGFNWQIETWGGVRLEECQKLLDQFFPKLR